MRISTSALLFVFIVGAAMAIQAQPGRFPDPMREEAPPKSLRDTLEKMRIEGAKKDHAEMLQRGEDAVKLATDLEEQIGTNGRLTESEREKISEVEKLVKKIRSDLGGRDGEESDAEDEQEMPATAKAAVGALRRAAVSLYDELKNASRFTVSASAIQTTNAILKVARFLRIIN